MAAGPECMAALEEFRSQLQVVVDLSVEDDLERAVFIGHRLVAAGQVDNAQATVTQRATLIQVTTKTVGAAMSDAVAHGPDERFGGALPATGDETGYAARGGRGSAGDQTPF